MISSRSRSLISIALLFSATAAAQLPTTDWEFERSYDDGLLYVHSLINYAYDLQWRYEWERRQLSDNSVRITTGSVASDELLSDVDININQPLNDRWRFQGRFNRVGLRQRAGSDEQLLLGFERSVFDASAIYLMVNPQYEKEFIDIAAGYTFYMDDRHQYVRVGLFFEDFTFDTKNRELTKSEQDQFAVQWQTRVGLGNDWFLFSEGEVGNGFDRVATDLQASPEVLRHERRENSAELRISRLDDDGWGWSAWIEWYDFREARQFQQPGFDYDYENSILNVAAEHTRIAADRHRWRFLLHYVDQQAQSRGFAEHQFDRREVLGGVFYEYLWPNSRVSLGYAIGQPDASYTAADPVDSFDLSESKDKLIAGWRYEFSRDAQVHVSLSHEVSDKGFGGGSVQFQLFF